MIKPINTLLLKLAFGLEVSQGYNAFKNLCKEILQDPNSKRKLLFDLFMILLVFISVGILIYEVKNELSHKIYYLELVITAFFIIEYLLRLWVHDDMHATIIKHYKNATFLGIEFDASKALMEILRAKWKYVSSFYAIIDFLAIMPSYRPLRILRIFLVFRILKVLRYMRGLGEYASVLKERNFEISTLALGVLFTISIASIVFYLFEAKDNGNSVQSLFDGFYLAAITIATVGYGDYTPKTHEGKVLAIILVFIGIALISFLTSIIVSAFQEKLDDIKNDRLISKAKKLSEACIVCGYGRMGEFVAQRLSDEGKDVIVIDIKKENIAKALSKGYVAIEGDASRSKILEDIRLAECAQNVIALTDSDLINAAISLNVRFLSKEINIIARCNDKKHKKKLSLAGANHVIYPYSSASIMASEFIDQPMAFEALYSILTSAKDATLELISVDAESTLVGKTLHEVEIEKYKLILFGVVKNINYENRDSNTLKNGFFYFNPKRDMLLHESDLIIVFGPEIGIEHLLNTTRKAIFK